MSLVTRSHAETIKAISQLLPSTGPEDAQAWQDLQSRLQNVVSDLPPEQRTAGRLLGLCQKAASDISTDLANALMSGFAPGTRVLSPDILAALQKALFAAQACLQELPEAEISGRQAGRDLKECLSQKPKTTQKETVMSQPEAPTAELSPAPPVSLDDVASLLMQLDVTQADELNLFREHLQAVAACDRIPEPIRDNMALAVFHLDSIADGGEDADLTLAEIGKLVEEAMAVRDQPPVMPKPVSAPPQKAGGATENIPAPPAADTPQAFQPPPQTTQSPQATGSARPEKAGTETESQDFGHLPPDADPDLLTEFIAEGTDLISSAEEALLALETDPRDMDAVATVFRAFHTVKGTSAFMGLTPLADMGHHAETLLSRVRDGQIRYAGGYADLALRALDMLKELIQLVQNALAGNVWEKPEGYDDLLELLKDPEGAGINEDFDDSDGVELRVGDMLVALGKADRLAVEKTISESPPPVGRALIKDRVASTSDVAHALRAQKRVKESQPLAESSVRVTTERLDRLIDMVGEMVIAHSMVAQDEVVVQAQHHDLMKKVNHTSKIVRELQNLSMSMRMIPLRSTFQKMTRLVRDVSRKVGKRVNLVTEGDETEIDRNMVNVINDPLMHMVRNAVDHGIELPEERRAAGKPEVGTVRLAAYHSAGSVVVAIQDDGKGISKEAILTKAADKGLLPEGKTLSDREIFNLVFEPGFSTAKVVTDVSGRGVGMDVVKRNIETLRGQVDIQSEVGKGSIFRMSLPLTLAIIDGMVVRVGRERYIIPTVSIVRSIKPQPANVSSVLKQGEMLSIQGKLIPIFRLARLYNLKDAQENMFEALVVVVEDEGHQVGLVIDEMIGRQQIVIKTLGEAMANIPGISGGAIMPNGRVGLILDVGSLIKLANLRDGEA